MKAQLSSLRTAAEEKAIKEEENKWKWTVKRSKAVIKSLTDEQLAFLVDIREFGCTVSVENRMYQRDKKNRPLIYG